MAGMAVCVGGEVGVWDGAMVWVAVAVGGGGRTAGPQAVRRIAMSNSWMMCLFIVSLSYASKYSIFRYSFSNMTKITIFVKSSTFTSS